MYFIARLFIVFYAVFFSFFPLANAMNEEESEYARSSFMFMERKQWGDALLHAKAKNDYALQTLITWQYLLDAEGGASYLEIKNFMDKNPDWPEQKKLRLRAESTIQDSGVSDDEIIEFFARQAPITGVGKMALVKALQTGGKPPAEMISSIVREAWRDGDFDESQEKYLLDNYGNLLKKSDDIARTDRLLWEGKITQAQRMFARVGAEREKLYKTRMALQADAKDATALLSKVPLSLKKDAGLMFDRMRFRAKKDDDDGVREILLAAPKKVPFPEKWWKYRDAKIREAIAENNVALAARLLANHGQIDGQGFADASWLRGRLLLRENHPKDAYKVFYKMFDKVKYPVSKARAAYWAARAAKQAGDLSATNSWLSAATAYPTTFYGQIAALIYNGTVPLHIPATPTASDEDRVAFEARVIVRAIKLCFEFNEPEIAGKLINYLAENSTKPKDAMLASELGKKSGKISFGVRAAKKALQNNVVLVSAGYPTPKTPENLAVSRALTLAISRQESEFDKLAQSPSGALGIMQLLPSTAKEVAQKNDISFSEEQLYNAEYNMTIGSLYLRKLIDNYDGTLPMAIAAYNAGMGNVYKWNQRFGKPEKSVDGMIDWMENIPFSETRNYVQRVLENLQVYRYIESGDESAKLMLGYDLTVGQ